MKPGHGLSDGTVARIAGVLARFTELERAVLFGSRAKATYRRGSDIDLALVGGALDWRAVGKIDDALDDLLLPYRFSLIIYDGKTDPQVTAHIQRVGIPFFEREAAGGALVRK
ncbi:MAG: nucleotidyltransferase domain-containing protein [Verrucomicrobiota bacterium]|nr:nucleotidyltransferase domain-containing protein [Verrucomicrobiota bacterium]